MEYSREQYIDALRKAHDAGDEAAVVSIGQQLDAMPEKPAALEGTYEHPLGFELERDGNAYQALVGAGEVVGSAVDGVQDLYLRGFGTDEEVAAHNKRADADEAIYDELAEYSPAARYGNVGGEVALGLATGVGTGAIARGATTALTGGARVAAGMGVAATEGAVVEGVRNRGDALDRVLAAGEGAAFGAAGQGVMDIAGKAIGATGRRVLKSGVKNQIVGAGDEAAEARKLQASRDGGFLLDDADAYVDRTAIARRDALRRDGGDGGSALAARHAGAEDDVTAAAQQFVDNGAEGAAKLDLNARSDNLASGLRSQRASAWAEVDGAYEQWRMHPDIESAPLETAPIQERLGEVFKLSKNTADGSIHRKLRGLLDQYGVTTSGLSEVEVPLTAKTYEDLVIGINGLYSHNNNSASKVLMHDVRELLEEAKFNMMDSAPGASREAIELGEAARSTRKAFAKEWERGDIVDKLTSKTPSGEEYRAKPVDAVRHLMNPRNLDDLKGIKDKMALSKSPEHKQFWSDVQAAPLFEAMEKATKGGRVTSTGAPIFNDKAFINEFSKYTDSQLTALYGADWVKSLKKAGKAWRLREARPDWQSNMNPSGSGEMAHSLASAGIRIAASRGAGGSILAIPAAMSGLGQWAAKRTAGKDTAKLLAGKLPSASTRLTEGQVAAALKEAWPNPQFLQFESAFAGMARAWVRSDSPE